MNEATIVQQPRMFDMDRERIECKVIRILSHRDVILNAGEVKGVKIGMVFHIEDDILSEDPATGQKYEPITFTKASVKVAIVNKDVAIASTFDRQGNGLTDAVSQLMSNMTRGEFKADQLEKSPAWDAVVRKGDRAIQADENELE